MRRSVALMTLVMAALPAPRAACEAGAAAPEPARVWVYRIAWDPGFAFEPGVWLDGEQVVDMDSGRFFLLELPPGPHEIRSTDPDAVFRRILEPGSETYLL